MKCFPCWDQRKTALHIIIISIQLSTKSFSQRKWEKNSINIKEKK